MSRFKLFFKTVVLLLSLMIGTVAADVFYQEIITDSSTYRVTRSMDGEGGILFEEAVEGNDEFGISTSFVSYTHSVANIYPPVLPDGAIRVARLKLHLRDYSNDEIVVTVDSMGLDHNVRRNFLVGPQGNDYVNVEESPLQNGTVEITLSNPDQEFVLYQSVFDMRYQPATPMDVNEPDNTAPETFELTTNYPNPFNPSTKIEYSLGVQSHVQIVVYDLVGREVKALVDKTQPAGDHSVLWDGTDAANQPVASGIYLYQIQTEHYQESKKMMLLK